MPSSRGSSWPRYWTHICYASCPGGMFLTIELSGKTKQTTSRWNFPCAVKMTPTIFQNEYYVKDTVPGYFLLRGFPGGTSGKESVCQCRRHKRQGFDSGSGRPLEKVMATYSSILASVNSTDRGAWWLQSMGSQSDMSDWAHSFSLMCEELWSNPCLTAWE